MVKAPIKEGMNFHGINGIKTDGNIDRSKNKRSKNNLKIVHAVQ